MAFLQPHIVPAMAEGIHRQLRGAPGRRLKRDSVEQLLLPKGAQTANARNVFHQTLRELVTIGAIEEDEDQLGLPVAIPWAADPGAMPRLIRDQAMSAERETDLWERDEDGALMLVGARDLVRAVAWFLSLDTEDGPFEFERTSPSVSDLQEVHLAGERPIYNRERWRPFVRWTRYLGFSSGWGVGSQYDEAVMPDPAVAIEPILRERLHNNDWTPVGEIVGALAAGLPVLDGGIYRAAVEAQGAPGYEADLSPSLSLAIRRLDANGTIELSVGGGDAVVLTLSSGLGAYHEIRLGGTAK